MAAQFYLLIPPFWSLNVLFFHTFFKKISERFASPTLTNTRASSTPSGKSSTTNLTSASQAAPRSYFHAYLSEISLRSTLLIVRSFARGACQTMIWTEYARPRGHRCRRLCMEFPTAFWALWKSLKRRYNCVPSPSPKSSLSSVLKPLISSSLPYHIEGPGRRTLQHLHWLSQSAHSNHYSAWWRGSVFG